MFVSASLVRVTSVIRAKPDDCSSPIRTALLVEPNASSCRPTAMAIKMYATSTTKATSTPTTCVRRRRPATFLLTTWVMRTVVGLGSRSLANAATKAVRSAAPKVASV